MWSKYIAQNSQLINIKDKTGNPIFTLILYPETLVKILVHFCVWCDVGTCVCAGKWVWTCMWSPEADVRCPPWWHSFFAWMWALSLSLSSLTQPVQLTRFLWGSPFHFWYGGVQLGCQVSLHLRGVWGLNSSHHTSGTNTLLTESSPQPVTHYIWLCSAGWSQMSSSASQELRL